MCVRDEFRALLPVLGVTLLFPVPLLNFVADGTGRAFAFVYLYFGCALVAAECFRTQWGRGRPRWERWRSHWRSRSSPSVRATPAVSGGIDAGAVALAVLTAVPALCLVPYLTQIGGRPYVAVAFSALLLGCVKLAGCVAARVVYGPTRPTRRGDGDELARTELAGLVLPCRRDAGLRGGAVVLSYRREAAPTRGVNPRNEIRPWRLPGAFLPCCRSMLSTAFPPSPRQMTRVQGRQAGRTPP